MQIVFSLILIWIAHFLVDFMIGVWSVYKTMNALDLGIAGLIAAACAFTGEGAQLFFGNLSDRGNKKRLIVLGVILTAANVLLAYTQAYFTIFILFLITCIGSGAFHPSAVAMIGGLTDKQKGLFISIFASGGALGMAVSQIVFAKSHAYFEGNTIPLLIPSILLAIVMMAFGYLGKENLITQGVERPSFGIKFIKNYFKDRSLRMLYIMQVCNQTIFWGSIFLLPDVLVSRGYEEDVAYGGGHFAFIIGSVFTMIPCGYLADRISARSVIFWCSLAGMIFYFSFLMIPLLPTPMLLLVLLAAGSVLGVVQPLAVALGNDLGRKNPGMVSAFTMGLVWCVSETVGPAGTGLVSKLFVEDAPAKSLMVFGLLFPVLLYAAYQLPRSSESSELAFVEAEEVE